MLLIFVHRYCDPSYSFPMQQNVIDHAVNLSVKKMAKEPSTLIIVGSYTIGKERVFTGMITIYW